MQKWFKILVLPFLVLFLLAGTALADNITIFDGRTDGVGSGIGLEVGETEPGMVNSPEWDLQAFLYEGTTSTLSMGGGFDFINGVSGYDIDRYGSGDIFLDIDIDPLSGGALYGTAATGLLNGYDFVIDVDWSSDVNGYNVYALNASSDLGSVLPYNSPYSNPWQFNHANEIAITSGTFTYSTDHLVYAHYVTGFDLSFLGVDQEFIAHFTMGCGNDNLMGHYSSVPEPAGMFLLGTGLFGLTAISRKKLFKK